MGGVEQIDLGKFGVKKYEKVNKILSSNKKNIILTNNRLLIIDKGIFDNDYKVQLDEIKYINKISTKDTVTFLKRLIPNIVLVLIAVVVVLFARNAINSTDAHTEVKLMLKIILYLAGIIALIWLYVEIHFLIYAHRGNCYNMEITQLVCIDKIINIASKGFQKKDYTEFMQSLTEATNCSQTDKPEETEKEKDISEETESDTDRFYKKLGIHI